MGVAASLLAGTGAPHVAMFRLWRLAVIPLLAGCVHLARLASLMMPEEERMTQCEVLWLCQEWMWTSVVCWLRMVRVGESGSSSFRFRSVKDPSCVCIAQKRVQPPTFVERRIDLLAG